MHGGATPVAKIKAENSLALGRMPAIETLLEMIEQYHEATCATCGFPNHELKEKKFVASVARLILDRTGLHPRVGIETSTGDMEVDPKLYTAEEKQELVALLAQVRAIKECAKRRLVGVAFGTQPAGEQPSILKEC